MMLLIFNRLKVNSFFIPLFWFSEAFTLICLKNIAFLKGSSHEKVIKIIIFITYNCAVSNFSTEINPLYENESQNPKDLSYKTEKSSSKIQKRPSSETFYSNVRGVLRRIQGLHVAKPGRQLFVRIRIRYFFCNYLSSFFIWDNAISEIFLIYLFIF